MMGYYYDGFWGGFGGLFMVLIWILVIWGVIALIRGMGGYGHHGRYWREEMRRDRSLEILKERYAKGEINKQEFEEKKKDLLGE